MAKHGKKYLAALAKIDENHWYTPEEAVVLVKETHYVKFDLDGSDSYAFGSRPTPCGSTGA